MGLLRQPVVQVPTQSQAGSDEQDGFSGGVNPAAAVGIVDPTQFAAMTNMRLVRDQEMAKRPGMKKIGSAAGISGRPFNTGAVSQPGLGIVLFVSGGTLQRIPYVWNDDSPIVNGSFIASGTIIDTTAAATRTPLAAVSFQSGGDAIYLANYSATTPSLLVYKNGALNAILTSGPPIGLSRIWVYNQRLFGVVGDFTAGASRSTLSQTLYWSGIGDGNTINLPASGGGSAIIRTYGGQKLVGGFALGSVNVLLHENAVSIFRGLTFDDISISAGTKGESPDIGLPKAWDVIDGIGYVLTTRGLYRVTEVGGFQPYASAETPDPIATLIRSTGTTGSASATTDFEYATNWFVVNNARMGEVLCFVSSYNHATSSTNTTVFVYSKRLQRFTGHMSLGIVVDNVLIVPISGTGLRPQIVVSSVTGGNTTFYGFDFVDATQQVYQDDSVSYTSSVQMRRFYTEKPSYQKAYRFLNVNMGAGSGETQTATGTNTGASVTYSTTTGGTVADTTNMKAQEVNIIQLSGQGSYLDATVTDNGASSTGWSVLRADVDAYILAQRAG